MQTSVKTKAKEFMKQNHPLDISEQDVEKLLLEHERDTRYTAIDIINNMKDYWVIVEGCSHLNGDQRTISDAVSKDDVTNLIHNMKVVEGL